MLTIGNYFVYNVGVPEKRTNGGDEMSLDLKRLKAERIAKGLTQDEMAQAMGWKTRTPYAKRENGIVGIGADELVKMANILGYNENELGIFFRVSVPEK